MRATLAHRSALVGRPSWQSGPSASHQGTALSFLQDDSCANFTVGDSCHVMGSERNIFAVWDDLAGNGVLQLPAKFSGPHEGSGPIGAPDSGDDALLLGWLLPALQVL